MCFLLRVIRAINLLYITSENSIMYNKVTFSLLYIMSKKMYYV